MSEQAHTLYRFFDAAGHLLYVGKTVAPSRRWREHERGASWFESVASVTREVHPDAEAVDKAERLAITTEGPLHNIALNPSAPTRPRQSVPRKPRKPSKPQRVLDVGDTELIRWGALPEDFDVPAEGQCEGDETICECHECHELRYHALEDLRSKYEWHPDLLAEIDSVETSYYAGHPLTEWYYDLFDIGMFARMRLVGESRTNPLPAYAEIEDSVASVECPLCFDTHKHYLASGAALSQGIDAACERIPGGRYALFTDWLDMTNALYLWGDRSSRSAA
jgi:hypothetical protein